VGWGQRLRHWGAALCSAARRRGSTRG
jgi:hypothetical protein